MKLLVASRNDGKLRELRSLLAPEGIEVIGLGEVGDAPEVVEDADTFLGNAQKKAWTLANAFGLPVLADDSGLSVEALGGRPGVCSARFSGPSATDADNNNKLLEELRGVPPRNRQAAFVCAMVLALPGNGERSAEGRLLGEILEAPRGTDGFGYDPLFLVGGTDRTLAELDLREKNSVSHRGKALASLLPSILELRSS